MATEEKDSAAVTRGYRKTRRGYVTSDKMDKTIVVEVEDRVKHALYGKIIRRTSKVKAHDELGIRATPAPVETATKAKKTTKKAEKPAASTEAETAEEN